MFFKAHNKWNLKLLAAAGLTVITHFTTFSIHLYAQAVSSCSYKEVQNGHREHRREGADDKGQKIFIPIVVHVVYSTGQQNISNEQIVSQVEILTEDFTRQNPDTVNTLAVFKQLAGNPKIAFYLAVQDVNGNSTDGITRTPTAHGPFANDDIHFTDRGGKSGWPAANYLNIWVCDLADGVFGFASPIGSNPFTEGVVIDYKFFGSLGSVAPPYNKGRTATHEIGHWMGLKHLWGSSGGCNDDDGIVDTPMQAGPSAGCNLSRTSCGNLNMVQNYMDNSTDDCMNFFTKGQVTEMRKNIFAYRPLIYQNDMVTGIEGSPILGIDIRQIDRAIYQVKSQRPIDYISVHSFLGQEVSYQHEQSSENELILNLLDARGIFLITLVSGNERSVKKVLLGY
jgi:hypothetical protein